MSSAKESILKKIKTALVNVPQDEIPEDIEVWRTYRLKSNLPRQEIIDLFIERVSEYKATVKKINRNKVQEAVAESCRKQKATNLVIPEDFPKEWIPDSIKAYYDQKSFPLSHDDLDHSDGVITTCALGVAETGTIILDAGQGQGRRVLTLLPDYHLCIIEEVQIVELVPEAFLHFESTVKDKRNPITFISGPSATSDIELNRVEGVHGPRRLEILIV